MSQDLIGFLNWSFLLYDKELCVLVLTQGHE